jgi:putative oxidoreductase
MQRGKIRSFLGSERVLLVCQLVLGGVFIFAALGKILHPEDFMTAVGNYRLLPAFLVKVTAYVLPWLEIVFGGLLVFNIFPRFSAAVLSLLLGVFIAALVSALIRGINIDCGCFWQSLNEGDASVSDTYFLIVRDVLFLIPGLIILFVSRDEGSAAP